MNIEFTTTAKKHLAELQKPEAAKVVRKLASLSSNPFLGKKLAGKLAGRYSLRAWPYRIIYIWDRREMKIVVDSIKHRQAAYK